jgi:xanthine dehydrogenase accessory factor
LLVGTPARYVGVMGSRRRWAATREVIDDTGSEPAGLARVRNPIGLDIGAESVEEIAVSIMSEIIASNATAAS